MKKIALLFLIISSFGGYSQQKKILFIMSSANELPLKNDKVYSNTGVFLSEFYLAYKDVIEMGYSVDFATPDGKVSSIDKESYEKKYWSGKEELIEEGTQFIKQNKKFNNPLTLKEAFDKSNEYSGFVVPGGQGLMVDLINNETMKSFLVKFGNEKKCIGLICHAPVLLTKLSKEENPFFGYSVNSVSGFEEFYIENFVMGGKPLNRKIGKQLKTAGFKYKAKGPAKNFAIKDHLLVTSQNPYSNEAFGKLFKKALIEYEKK